MRDLAGSNPVHLSYDLSLVIRNITIAQRLEHDTVNIKMEVRGNKLS